MRIYAFPTLSAVAGAVLIAQATALPPYHDTRWEDRFIHSDVTSQNSSELSTEWYAAKAKAETPRNRRLDLGTSFVGLGLALALLMALRRVSSARDLASITTPSTRLAFYLWAAFVWLSFVPAEWLWLTYTQRRGDYPWWADSIGIPAGGVLMFGLLGLPLVLMGATLALRGARLPVCLLAGPALGPPYIICGGLLLTSLLAALVLASSLASEPFLVPSSVFTLYLLLSGRAAAASCGRRLLWR